tara:strand:+ start:3218 stop:3454 length:237 start_codon:yes stop_codon:yes gene_type:complete
MKKHNKKLVDDVRTYLKTSDNQKNDLVSKKKDNIRSEKSDSVDEKFLREEIKSWIKENGELVASKVIKDIVKALFIKK